MMGFWNDHGSPKPAEARSLRIISSPITPSILLSAVLDCCDENLIILVKVSPATAMTMTNMAITIINSIRLKPLLERSIVFPFIVLTREPGASSGSWRRNHGRYDMLIDVPPVAPADTHIDLFCV